MVAPTTLDFLFLSYVERERTTCTFLFHLEGTLATGMWGSPFSAAFTFSTLGGWDVGSGEGKAGTGSGKGTRGNYNKTTEKRKKSPKKGRLNCIG